MILELQSIQRIGYISAQTNPVITNPGYNEQLGTGSGGRAVAPGLSAEEATAAAARFGEPELQLPGPDAAEGRRLQQAPWGAARPCRPAHSAWIQAGGGENER